MNASVRSIRDNPLRTVLPAVFLAISFAVLSTRANADPYSEQYNPITISKPIVKYTGSDYSTGAPRTETMVVATVRPDTSLLTLNSGVALFKHSVVEAARKACGADDLHGKVDTTCLRVALKDAKPQMDALIAKARSESNG